MSNYTLLEAIAIIQLKVPVEGICVRGMQGNDGDMPASKYKWPPGKFRSMLLNMGKMLTESNKSDLDFKSSMSIVSMLGNPVLKM